jgi:hypothetical protein
VSEQPVDTAASTKHLAILPPCLCFLWAAHRWFPLPACQPASLHVLTPSPLPPPSLCPCLQRPPELQQQQGPERPDWQHCALVHHGALPRLAHLPPHPPRKREPASRSASQPARGPGVGAEEAWGGPSWAGMQVAGLGGGEADSQGKAAQCWAGNASPLQPCHTASQPASHLPAC